MMPEDIVRMFLQLWCTNDCLRNVQFGLGKFRALFPGVHLKEAHQAPCKETGQCQHFFGGICCKSWSYV